MHRRSDGYHEMDYIDHCPECGVDYIEVWCETCNRTGIVNGRPCIRCDGQGWMRECNCELLQSLAREWSDGDDEEDEEDGDT